MRPCFLSDRDPTKNEFQEFLLQSRRRQHGRSWTPGRSGRSVRKGFGKRSAHRPSEGRQRSSDWHCLRPGKRRSRKWGGMGKNLDRACFQLYADGAARRTRVCYPERAVVRCFEQTWRLRGLVPRSGHFWRRRETASALSAKRDSQKLGVRQVSLSTPAALPSEDPPKRIHSVHSLE